MFVFNFVRDLVECYSSIRVGLNLKNEFFSLMGFEPRTACWTERINPLLFWRERVRGREREKEEERERERECERR